MTYTETSTETIIKSKEEGKDVIVMSLDDYNGWTTTNHLLSNPANAKRLLDAIEDVKAGKVIKRDIIDE
jgi:antitoxin YefM